MDDGLLEQLSRQVRLEMERTELERQRLAEEQATRQLKAREVANVEDLLRRYAGLGERVDGLLARIEEQLDRQPTVDVIQEWFEELSEHIEQVEQYLVLIVGRSGDPAVVTRAVAVEELASKRRQLRRRRANLNRLQEQAACRGSDIPLWLANQIEDEQGEIERLEREIETHRN